MFFGCLVTENILECLFCCPNDRSHEVPNRHQPCRNSCREVPSTFRHIKFINQTSKWMPTRVLSSLQGFNNTCLELPACLCSNSTIAWCLQLLHQHWSSCQVLNTDVMWVELSYPVFNLYIEPSFTRVYSFQCSRLGPALFRKMNLFKKLNLCPVDKTKAQVHTNVHN